MRQRSPGRDTEGAGVAPPRKSSITITCSSGKPAKRGATDFSTSATFAPLSAR